MAYSPCPSWLWCRPNGCGSTKWPPGAVAARARQRHDRRRDRRHAQGKGRRRHARQNRIGPRRARLAGTVARAAAGSWQLDGAMPLARLREVPGIGEALPGEASGAYQTLAGFVLEQLRQVSAVSDSFVWERYRFEVVDMDRHRIDRVLVAQAGEAGGAAPARPR
ncbi:transporter associated domain-containing protein [Massilia antarctica]|uniref:transporter associated domain-containing protein n=1 Tax=Massilia antarctica TaxID=2765360 RepID=UPI00351CF2B6